MFHSLSLLVSDVLIRNELDQHTMGRITPMCDRHQFFLGGVLYIYYFREGHDNDEFFNLTNRRDEGVRILNFRIQDIDIHSVIAWSLDSLTAVGWHSFYKTWYFLGVGARGWSPSITLLSSLVVRRPTITTRRSDLLLVLVREPEASPP